MKISELQSIAASRGHSFDDRGADVGRARIVIDGEGALLVSTSDRPTADALWSTKIGHCLYRQASNGYLTLTIPDRQLRPVIAVIERAVP